MALIITAITTILSILIVVGTLIFLKKKLGGAGSAQTAKIMEEISTIDVRLKNLSSSFDGFASQAQLEWVVSQTQEFVSTLENQKSLLKEIEQKLDVAQKDVETKEVTQQETKSAKEEDEAKLQELLAAFENVSTESIGLEQRLAQSLKNLDTLIGEVQLTDDQKLVLTELSNTLTSAGGRLRDLITEHRAINERLEGLKEQHGDLEDEYTKLVEQQLGA